MHRGPGMICPMKTTLTTGLIVEAVRKLRLFNRMLSLNRKPRSSGQPKLVNEIVTEGETPFVVIILRLLNKELSEVILDLTEKQTGEEIFST